jgi:hypothetical protein
MDLNSSYTWVEVGNKLITGLNNHTGVPRMQHVMAVIPQTETSPPCLLIHGGFTDDDKILSDPCLFNLKEFKWTQITSSSPQLKSQASCIIQIDKEFVVILSGGITIEHQTSCKPQKGKKYSCNCDLEMISDKLYVFHNNVITGVPVKISDNQNISLLKRFGHNTVEIGNKI